jgi:hypothetical protein
MTFRNHNINAVSSPEDVGAGTVADAGTLARTVMLVYLRVSAWSGLRQDKRANASVAAAHGSKAEATRVSKHLIPPASLAPVMSAAGAIRAYHYSMTLPWLDDGARVLTAAGFFKYREKMTELIRAYKDAAETLALDYPQLVRDAARELGDLFSPSDYPKDITRKFDADTTFLPFPKADDFRVSGINGAEAEIKAKLDSLPAIVEAKAREEIGSRVLDVASRIVERMGAYTGGKAGSFRDSLVQNVRDLVEILPMLNVSGDLRVAEITADLARLAEYDPDTLRESEAARATAKAQAEAIVSKMEGFI